MCNKTAAAHHTRMRSMAQLWPVSRCVCVCVCGMPRNPQSRYCQCVVSCGSMCVLVCVYVGGVHIGRTRAHRSEYSVEGCGVARQNTPTIKYTSKIYVWRKRFATCDASSQRCEAPCSPKGCTRIVICPQQNTFVLGVSLPFIQSILMRCYSRCTYVRWLAAQVSGLS